MIQLQTNSCIQSILNVITQVLLVSHVSTAFLSPHLHSHSPNLNPNLNPNPNPNPKTTKLYLDGEGMAGKTFNKHLFGDILRSLQPRYLDQMKNSIAQNLQGATDLHLDSFQTYVESLPPMSLPKSWSELTELYDQSTTTTTTTTTPTEQSYRTNIQKGSIPSASSTIRINPNNPLPSTLKLTLYKDSASWCPYCQKVWIAMEEMNLSYHIQTVDMNCYAGGSKPNDFLEVQPSGNLPCIVMEDEVTGGTSVVIQESNDFLFEFWECVESMVVSGGGVSRGKTIPRLYPTKEETDTFQRVQWLCNDGRNSLERRLFAEWMWYLTGKRKPTEYRERYEQVLDEVNQVLSERQRQRHMNDGPYFMGSELSVVDIQFIPFVERQVASLAYFKGFHVRDETKWPYLVKWIEAMEQRESYRHTKSDFYTHSRSLPPQLSGGCSFYDGCEDYRDSIDAYSQPISYYIDPQNNINNNNNNDDDNDNDNASIETYLSWTEPGWDNDIPKARREAAERIIYNHEKIIKFASRAAGTPGLPAASAPLADPRAMSNTGATHPIDLLLRHVVQSLLVVPEQTQTQTQTQSTDWDLSKVAQALRTQTDGTEHSETLLSIVACLDYVRARIGVPRDMSYPAAREFKKELLTVSSILMDVSIPGISSNALMNEEEVLL